jgi:mycothiol system anti-sigma-R factor
MTSVTTEASSASAKQPRMGDWVSSSVGEQGDERGECGDAVHQLYLYLDGELTSERRELIQHHLDSCPPCFEAYDFEAELRQVIAHRCREQVPDQLRVRVARALGLEPPDVGP